MVDNVFGTTEIADVTVADIQSVLQSLLIQKSMMVSKVTDVTKFATKGKSTIDFPKMGNFTVKTKTSGQQTDTQVATLETDQLALDLHKYIQFVIVDRADVQSIVDILSGGMERSIAQLSLDVDTSIIASMIAGVSSSTPDNSITFDGSTMVLADILEGRKLLLDQYLNPQFDQIWLAVGPEREAELLALDALVNAEKYGSNEAVQLGELGRIYGTRVMVHTGLGSDALMWTPSAQVYGSQIALNYKSEGALRDLGKLHSFDHLYGTATLDDGKRMVYITAA